MARIAGVDIPREKRLEISLTYIFGIGLPTAQAICAELGLDPNTKVSNLTEDEVNRMPNRQRCVRRTDRFGTVRPTFDFDPAVSRDRFECLAKGCGVVELDDDRFGS